MNVFDKVLRSMVPRRRYTLGDAAAVGAALGFGAGLMYTLDPDRGSRRRSIARDKAVSFAHRTGALLDESARDLRNRSRGVVAETGAIFRQEAAPDAVLSDRVRAKLGRVVSHPHAIDVEVLDGCVTLRGPVLAQEVDDLLAAVSGVDGVTRVSNALEAHPSAEGIPSLQGSSARTGERLELTKASGSPAARTLMGALGAGLVGYALRRRGPLGLLLGVAGAAVLLRELGDRPTRHLAGVDAERRALAFQKTITVRAPVREVFLALIQFESFPRFMSHLRQVETLGDGRMRWTAADPAGIPVSWDAELTQLVPNEVVAWRSLPGQAIDNEGIVRLEECPEGTRLDVKMSYNPPAGALGHAAATLFGADPEHAMAEDFARFKALIEQGKTTVHGEEVVSEDLQGAHQLPSTSRV
ncbi:SRPBCC family protein [Sorangium sp. So ce1151]|uniref:SRPBCC family protein n=1 Tax=Sorangium sp. So ce1151 TaxID=3133332 RepID=UPI003F5FDC88